MKPWDQLSFEERQAAWDGSPRQFQQNNGRGDRATVWEIKVVGDRVFTQHGLVGGAVQTTDRVGKAKNVGKANYISPEVDALAEARRSCRKRYDFEGYDEYFNGVNIDRRNVGADVQAILTNLPGSFCLYKPDNSLSSKALCKMITEGKAKFVVKRNGFAYWAVVDFYGNVKLYSRRSRQFPDGEGPTERDDGTLDWSTAKSWNLRFPQIVAGVQALGLPPGSMLAIEVYFPRTLMKEDFKHVQSVVQSLTDEAIVRQQEKGWVRGYLWDIPFYDGKDLVSTTSIQSRYDLINYLFHQSGMVNNPSYLDQVMVAHFTDVEAAQKSAIENFLEGWVVIDPDGIYGDKGWTLKGKPDRPAASCAKCKPWLEDDFVVMWDPANKRGTYGKGRHEPGKLVTLPDGSQVVHGGVGSVALHQYNKKGELVYISDLSSGMDYAFQAKLNASSFPQVWRILYTERSYQSEGDDTNALIFAKMDPDGAVRTDKLPAECINDRL